MSMLDRYRRNREVARRHRAVDRALRSANTPALRDEILSIADRQYSPRY